MGIPPIANAKPVEAVAAKEKAMDRNYFYQKRAGEHQREISQELATLHLPRIFLQHISTCGIPSIAVHGTTEGTTL